MPVGGASLAAPVTGWPGLCLSYPGLALGRLKL